MLPRTDYDTLVVTPPGLEEVTQRELATLGVVPSAEPQPGAIPLRASLQTLYTLNLNLRTASRITVTAAEFRARTFAELERHGTKVPWDEWLRPGAAVRLRVTCRKSRLYHSDAVAERIAGAIISRSDAEVLTGDEDREPPADSQRIIVRLLRDNCTIRFDTSGAHLHRRGYRQAVAKAPLRETLAAAMLLGARWDAQAPLVDPFCGSGTIPIEAALQSCNIAPGIQREFAFMKWPNFNAKAWDAALDRARSRERSSRAPIYAADRDAGAIEAARANAVRAGVLDHIVFENKPLSALREPATPGWLVTNPPYGVRVGERGQLRDLYATLGRMSQERLSAWHIALLSAHPELDAQLALPLKEVFRTTNGGLAVRLVMRIPLERTAGRSSRAPGGSLG
ncbi:MAG: THUMP domain-containing class I SAM-dependent RNA methyltransferase [Gemmatimonadaceae bacterium]